MTHRHDDPENGEGHLMRQNGPWWSRSLWQVGPLAIGFLMLLAAMLGWTPFASKHANSGAGAASLHQKLDEHISQSKDTLRVLRAICRHTARSEPAKEDCDR